MIAGLTAWAQKYCNAELAFGKCFLSKTDTTERRSGVGLPPTENQSLV